MKHSRGKILVMIVVGLTSLTLTAIATVASPDRHAQRTDAAPLSPSRPLPPPRPFLIPHSALTQPQPADAMAPPAVPSVASRPSTEASVTSGTWTPLNNQPSFLPGSVFLLTDGTVLAQDDDLTTCDWWKLTPDNTDNYINGGWTQGASPAYSPN